MLHFFLPCTMLSCTVKTLIIEASNKTQPINFENIAELDLDKTKDAELQHETIQLSNIKARYIKFKIMSGYFEYPTVHSIKIEGIFDDLINKS